MSAVVIFVD